MMGIFCKKSYLMYTVYIMQPTILQKIVAIIKTWTNNLWINHKKKTISGLVLFLIILFMIISKSNSVAFTDVYTVTNTDIIDQVILSGRSESLQDVNLGFADSGRVAQVMVSEGDKVKQGQVLAKLEMGDLVAQYKNAVAGVTIARENLKQSYTRVEQVMREQDILVQAAKKNLYTNLEAYPEDTSVRLSPPEIYGTYQGETDGVYKLDIYPSSALSGASINFSGLELGTASFTTDNRSSLGTKGLYIQFPSSDSATYVSTDWVIPIPNNRSSTYASLKNAYDSAVLNREHAIENARAEVLGSMGSIMQAKLDQAESSQAQIVSAMSRRTITAPFAGTISKVSLKQGESTIGTSKDISPGISMLATDQYKVVIKIPEIDVSRIVANTPVVINLDAYGNEVSFAGTLTSINPAETIVDGVPVYEGTVLFTDSDDRIRSGMTATVTIVISEKKNTLTIPADYIREDKVLRKYFVDVITGKNKKSNTAITTERLIVPGIRGSNGQVEILSGIETGEQIVKTELKK